MPLLTLEPLAARQLHAGRADAVLLDVRTPAEFAASHIVGSRNVPLETLDPAALRSGSLGPDMPVTVVCASGARARRAAERLNAAGFGNVAVLEGGLKAWTAAGLPVATGSGGAINLERQVRIAAGSLVVLGVLIAWALTPWGVLLSLLVGAGLVFSGVTDTCGMGLVLARAPWNRRALAATP